MPLIQSLRRRVGDAVYTAREALSLPRTRKAALRDVGGRAEHGADECHLAAAIDWLCRAQDACPEGGVSYAYDLRKGWLAAYPETTGYIIPTLFDYACHIGDRDQAHSGQLRDRAIGLARWLTRVQLESGAIPGGTVLLFPQPTVFNTGQVLDGWCRTLRETDADDVRDAIRRAAAWLISVQDADGCWRRGLSPLTPKTPAAYNVRTASVLLRAGLLLDEAGWRDAAIRNGDWVLAQQQPNGWFDNNCVTDNANPLTHTIGYTLEGLLELAMRTGLERYLAAVMRASDALLPHVAGDGFLAGRFDADWRPAASWNCLTGASQLAMVWFRLARATGDDKYADAARRALDFVKTTQVFGSRLGEQAGITGGIKGSHPVWGRYEPFAYPNWATKFFADALFASSELTRNDEADRVPIASDLRVAYVVEDYPTFIVSEISQLRRLGAVVTLLSAFRPKPEADPMKDALRRESVYYPAKAVAVLAANIRVLFLKPLGYLSVLRRLIRERESLRFLVLGSCHAEVLARDRINHVHGTFGTRTTTLAWAISKLSGIDYSFTTHAYDIFCPNPSLVWKTNESVFMRTISHFNRRFISEGFKGVNIDRVRVVHMGVDTSMFQPAAHSPRASVRVVSIGSLIPKKGHRYLVEACAQLIGRGVPIECRIIGGGPLRADLMSQIALHGLDE